MKSLLLILAISSLASVSFAQNLQKGNLVGVHLLDVSIQPNVTYNQWKDIYINKLIPKINEAYQDDAKVYLVEGIRGEGNNEIGLIYVFKSEETRNKYHNEDGGLSEYGIKWREKWSSVLEELEEYEKEFSTKYTDWIVQ